jgi:predicted nuclease with TOPRIM domain
MALTCTATIFVADLPEVTTLIQKVQAENERLRGEVQRLMGDLEAAEDNYDELLSACGGVWPG